MTCIKGVHSGSSPRMRGTLHFVKLVHLRHGIIPAYAGNTPVRLGRSLPCRDHPRVCGEHVNQFDGHCPTSGSSPRMRGTLGRFGSQCGEGGIIPAYAGNTMGPSPVMTDWRDHPRVCGEHLWYCPHGQRYEGSSPRMRGTLLTGMIRLSSLGIIPAYAGNTSFGL